MSSNNLSLSSSLFSIQPSMPVALAFRLVQEEKVEPSWLPALGLERGCRLVLLGRAPCSSQAGGGHLAGAVWCPVWPPLALWEGRQRPAGAPPGTPLLLPLASHKDAASAASSKSYKTYAGHKSKLLKKKYSLFHI